MRVKTELFGTLPTGSQAHLFTFNTGNGLVVRITNFGGIITSIEQADRDGRMKEITAGFGKLDGYLKGHPHFGVIVGRYANRIARGSFNIDGQTYTLPINNPPNHLHGGKGGFHTKLWNFNLEEHGQTASLTLRYESAHLEEGYPGTLDTTVKYTITPDNAIRMEFSASSDRKTHVNLTSHCYFNLNGFKNGIEDHSLQLASTRYLPTDATQIPTGAIAATSGTPFDLSEPTLLSSILQNLPNGLDHCYVLDPNREASATLHCSQSGRKLTLFCTQPGMQVYTGNFLDGSIEGHNGVKYQKQWAVCLEPQHFPDSPNQPNFPSTLIAPGQVYKHKITLCFGID